MKVEMQDDIKVTVYCMTYNHEKYIRDALEGFVMQKTNFLFEVLVHDDASMDGTVEIIREFQMKYPKIIKPILQKENMYSKGANMTYEYLLPNSNGKYIAFCEGDDYWTDSSKLQRQYDYMESHKECALVVHKTVCEYVDRGYKEAFSKYQKCEIEANEIINEHGIFHTSSMFFRKEFYYRNEKMLTNGINFDYVIKILLATEGSVHMIPEVMSVYRKGTEGSWTKDMKDISKHISHSERAIDVLNKIDEYREYMYTQDIQKNILRRKFRICVIRGEYDKLRIGEFKNIYDELSYKRKIILYITEKLPFLAKCMHNSSLYWKLKRIVNRKKYDAK